MTPTIDISIYAATSLVATIANLIFAIFVLLKNPSSRINQLWAFTIVSLCTWGFSEFILRITPDYPTAEIVGLFGGMGFCFLPAPFLHFASEFTGRYNGIRKWIVPLYSFAVVLSLLHVEGYVTKIIHLPWGFTFSPNMLYILFIIWLEFCFSIGIYWCAKKYRNAISSRERKQTLLIILGATVPLTIGSLTDAFLPMFGMEVYRLAVVTTTATVALVSTGVVKYQLMSLTPETTASIILETMADLVVVTDTKGVVRFANKAFRESLGFETTDIRLENFIDDGTVLNEAFRSDGSIKCESIYRRRDGTTFPVSLSVTHIIDKQEHVGIIFVAIDISDLTAVEGKLRESEAMFRALSEASPASIFVYQNEKFLYVNKGALAVNGYTYEEMMSMKFTDLLHPDVRETVREQDEARLRSEDFSHRYEMKILRKNGEIRWLDFAAARIELNGRTAGVGLAFDITERKLADEQMKEQAALLNKANDAIIVFDVDERIRFWNSSAEQLYGWKASEVTGKKIRNVIRMDDDEKFANARETIFTHNEWNDEMKQLKRDGKEIIVASRWTLINDADGNPKSVLLINTDITEKKALEKQFLRMQRLESLGTLTSGISHDLNNILSPIMVGVGSIRRTLKNEKKEVLEMMENSAKRGAALVQQILTFARGTSAERSVVNVKYLLWEMEKIVQETFPKSIKLNMQLSKDIQSIIADDVQLHQVFLNLFVNARDAMPDGGMLSVRAENFYVDETLAAKHIGAKKGPYVRVAVVDNGTGIPPGVLDRIFDPFFTTKPIGHGTGLGLSTVISILKSHGGFIHVESTVNAGTTFYAYFPAVNSVHVNGMPEDIATIPFGEKELILIVDDESSIVEILRETLESHHYTVVTASNGKEAVDIFAQRKEEIKAVLIDLWMPFMDGPTAIGIMKSLRNDVKIIAVSGNSPTLPEFNPHKSDLAAFLQKPFSTFLLLETLRTVLKEPSSPVSK